MIVKRLMAAALAFCWALPLGSCSPFSSYIADSWPHWAGGEPAGLPPRPGTPGYEEFIAHGQPSQNAQSPLGNTQPAGVSQTSAIAGQNAPGTDQKPAAFAEPPSRKQKQDASMTPQLARPADDASIIRGGLY